MLTLLQQITAHRWYEYALTNPGIGKCDDCGADGPIEWGPCPARRAVIIAEYIGRDGSRRVRTSPTKSGRVLITDERVGTDLMAAFWRQPVEARAHWVYPVLIPVSH